MALVRKLAPGGTIDQDRLNEEINKQISNFQLKAKDEGKVRQALVGLRDYFSTPEGKSLSVDPVSQKYTITGSGSEQFTGSPDEIHRGWLSGNLKIKNDQDAMSAAVAIFNEARKNITGVSTSNETPAGTNIPSDKAAVSMGDLNRFMIDKKYGTQENFKSQFGGIKTNEEKKS